MNDDIWKTRTWTFSLQLAATSWKLLLLVARAVHVAIRELILKVFRELAGDAPLMDLYASEYMVPSPGQPDVPIKSLLDFIRGSHDPI